jgi:dihydroorotate dehydrogenase (fumarate)/dihydroorotate dehydrogenase
VEAARVLAPHAGYLMLNLSCPNTADGRDFFLEGNNTKACIAALSELKLKLPVFMKASSAAASRPSSACCAAADGHDFIAGFMFKPGARQARQAQDAGCAVALAARHRGRTGVGVPGADGQHRGMLPPHGQAPLCADLRRSGDDRGGRLCQVRNGASLVQLFTAMVYEGPLLARRIARGLARLLERDGFKSVSEAVGADVR